MTDADKRDALAEIYRRGWSAVYYGGDAALVDVRPERVAQQRRGVQTVFVLVGVSASTR